MTLREWMTLMGIAFVWIVVLPILLVAISAWMENIEYWWYRKRGGKP